MWNYCDKFHGNCVLLLYHFNCKLYSRQAYKFRLVDFLIFLYCINVYFGIINHWNWNWNWSYAFKIWTSVIDTRIKLKAKPGFKTQSTYSVESSKFEIADALPQSQPEQVLKSTFDETFHWVFVTIYYIIITTAMTLFIFGWFTLHSINVG